MGAEILVSTGAFTGRVNARNHRLAIDYFDRLDCDGLELMLFPSWRERMDEIRGDYIKSGVRVVAIHAEKQTGELMSDETDEAWEACRALFADNCETARLLGAKKMVVHIWGPPASDRSLGTIARRCGLLFTQAQARGVDLVVENTACFSSPIRNLEEICRLHPRLGVTIDTRPAQFHREIERTIHSPVFEQNMRHIHINDFRGGYMQWDALYPILQPGKGDVDFEAFFARLREIRYGHTITLEAPSMLPDRVDCETLNRGLAFIRQRIQ